MSIPVSHRTYSQAVRLPADFLAAKGMPLGVFYLVQRPTFGDRLEEVKRKAQPNGPLRIEELFARFK
jgi:hypothetical protein